MGVGHVLDERLALVRFADIGLKKFGAPAVVIDGADHLLTVLRRAGRTDHYCTFAGEYLGDTLTDTPAGARYDRNFSIDTDAHGCFLRIIWPCGTGRSRQ